jgi:GalNAc-alpha-(1->4)-GalNAc-alpha-(1->3)-diNAcBac-PP-undecaprenol alpha-1,4-N-acetyl-D-galactosaminyltransferase
MALVDVPSAAPAASRPAVAFYFYKLGAAGGGAERMVCQIAGAMAERGFAVHLITWDAADATPFYPISAGVNWVRLGFAPGLRDKLRRVAVLCHTLKQHQIRILVGFVMSGDRTVYAAARLANARLVAAERNAPEMYAFRYGPWQRWLTFKLLALTERITIQMPGFAAGYPPALRSRLVTIPNPVPAAQTHAAPGSPGADGRFVLLAVSRLDADQKRIACLVSAFAALAASFPQWDLRIVGDGPERDALQRQIERLGLASRIRIEPSTPDIFDTYAHSHLFAIPSRWEGFPNALAEAMSHGLPAVGFAAAAGVAELIADAGWLAAGLDDAQALAAALGEAMQDGDARRRRGEAAARRMSAFAPATQFDCWATLLRQLTAEGVT